MFRIVLLGVKRLSLEERAQVDAAIADARATFEALDPAPGSDLAIYTILEDDGLTSEQKDVIAPVNDELAPGGEVALDGQVSTFFRSGPADDPGANVSLHLADRIVKADWKAFWSQAPE